MKKNQIRSKVAKKAIVDADALAKTLKENTENSVRNLLSETVKNEFRNFLVKESEDDDDDDDYDVDTDDDSQVEDTDTDTEDDNIDSDTDDDSDGEPDGDEDDDAVEDADTDDDLEATDDSDSADMNDFDQYKVSDNEYDLTNADDDEIVKVYKLLNNDDQVMVTKTDDKVNIKDNETGAEYLIDLGDENSLMDDDTEDDSDLDDDSFDLDTEEENDDDMNESTIYEIALKEYNSNVGYTDNYQNKDAMKSNLSVNEPSPIKGHRDWDKGIPHDTSKPWSKLKAKQAPFDKDGAKKVEEAVDESMTKLMDEANLSQSRFNDTHAVHNRVPAANKLSYRRKGLQKISHGTKYHGVETSNEETNESVKKIYAKAQAILKENAEIKNVLSKVKGLFTEAAVTNVHLGNIIKLITENSTTADEKKNIIARFANEANSVKSSNKLYESMSRELKNKKPINEVKLGNQFSAAGSKQINETKLYESKDMDNIKDLMNRMEKLI